MKDLKDEAAGRDHCVVTVCRGCCCGDPKQYPEVDHAGLLADLSRRTPAGTTVRVTDCLLRCEDANVVVVSPSKAARLVGASPIWLARILRHAQNEQIAGWIAAGGPGTAPMPPALTDHLTAPFRGR